MIASNRDGCGGGLIDVVSGRMLLLFFILTFVISWFFWAPMLLGVPEAYHLPLISAGAFGPLVSSLIVIRINHGHGGVLQWLREILHPRGVVLWILTGAFLLPVIVGGLHYGLYRILGGAVDFSGALPWYSYLLALIPTALLTGGNEEPGWRGFALPALIRRFHPITATLILGVIHSAWHLPLMGRYETSFGVYLFNLVGLTFIFNWLYFKSQRSVLPVMLFHAGTNVIGRFLPTPLDVLDGFGTHVLLRGVIYWIIAIALLIATAGRLGCRKKTDRAAADGRSENRFAGSESLS